MFSQKYLYIVIVVTCIAIACIVATVLFIAGSSRNSSSSTVTPTATVTPTSSTPMAGIPVYRGSIEYSLASYYYTLLGIPREGHKGVIYKVYFVENATVRDILNWYKNNLAGYEVVADYGISTISTPEGSIEWGAIMFKKDREGVGIWAWSGASIKIDGKSGTVYCVVIGDIENLVFENLVYR